MDAAASARQLERARLRQEIAAEVIEWCRRGSLEDRPFDRALALELHELHIRHSRELGRHQIAERAEARYARALQLFQRPASGG
jgi:hypothetical protein